MKHMIGQWASFNKDAGTFTNPKHKEARANAKYCKSGCFVCYIKQKNIQDRLNRRHNVN